MFLSVLVENGWKLTIGQQCCKDSIAFVQVLENAEVDNNHRYGNRIISLKSITLWISADIQGQLV